MTSRNNDAPNLQEIHDSLIEIAFRAGSIITSALPATSGTDSKKNSADLVTQYDRAVEEMISTTLREKYPHYKCVSVPSYLPGRPMARMRRHLRNFSMAWWLCLSHANF